VLKNSTVVQSDLLEEEMVHCSSLNVLGNLFEYMVTN
jgi:hypothetical protein